MLKGQGNDGISKKTRIGGRKISVDRHASPMYPEADELYGLVKDIVRSAWKAKAAREGKTMESVVREELKHAIKLGASIDVEREVKKAMASPWLF